MRVLAAFCCEVFLRQRGRTDSLAVRRVDA